MAGDTPNTVEGQLLLLRSGSVIIGTQENDALVGTALDDVIVGRGGDDDIRALGGDDFIDGGAGNDTVDGGDGDDFFLGGDGNDTVIAGAGADTIDYSALTSPIVLRPRGVVLNGDPTLDDPARAGLERALNGASPVDEAVFVGVERVSSGNSLAEGLVAGSEKDLLVGIERIVGAPGQPNVIDARGDPGQVQVTSIDVDLAVGSLIVRGVPRLGNLSFQVENFTTVFGTSNADFIRGDGKANTLSGEDGDDVVLGGEGNDVINGDAGNDNLFGEGGDDVINGGTGDDFLTGDIGDDVLNGGDGDDKVFGGQGGNDVLDGGVGFDTAFFDDATAGVSVDLRRTDAQNTGGSGVDTLVDIEGLFGSDFDDVLIGKATGSTLGGGRGNDLLLGTGAGNDRLLGGQGDDTLSGGAGQDTADYSALFPSPLFSHLQIDLAVDGPQDTGEGLDVLISIENILGSSAGDFLAGNARANRLEGNRGDDELFGRGGRDSLFGGDGNDLLDGGAGADTLTGGSGADRFVLDVRGPIDTLVDFVSGEDQVILRGLQAGVTVADLFAPATQAGGGARATLSAEPGSGSFVLQDLGLGALSPSDIVIAT